MYSMIYKKTGVSNNFLFDVYTTAIVGGMFIMVLEMGFFTVQRSYMYNILYPMSTCLFIT